MAAKPYRIDIPTTVKDYKELIEDIDAENDERGDASELKAETAEIKEGVVDMTEADKLESEAEAHDKAAEKLREKRDLLWKKKTLGNERGWRKTLEGKFIKAIHKMGDFGYVVNSSPKPKKPPVG